MYETKEIRYIGVPIVVMLGEENEKAPSGSGCSDTGQGGVFWDESEKKLKVFFKGLINSSVLSHESWHCFCAMMDLMGDQCAGWDEATKEIYAYSFSNLLVLLEETTTGMKLYRKMWKGGKEGK